MPAPEEQPVHSTPRADYGQASVDESHPAFGVAVVSRGHGSSRSLFQSDVLHHDSITLSIQTATRARYLNHDSVFPRKTLVEVEMSLAQWGALVSSIGIGSGIPVTIRRTENETFVPTIPYQPRIKESLAEVTGSISKLFAQARETLAVLEDAFETKKGVRAMRDALRNHRGSILHASANSEFAVASLAAAGEKVTSQVRADIESQILNASRLTSYQGAISAPEMRFDEISASGEKAAPETEHDDHDA
ncbi:hypothetical protein [Cryobacterium zhongshanensis]|uniref:Uncharacterized protein n=1 Tax=Cryobacterium zhongshanensis TaxID=2928153 RepID=A0AA41R276_9MICO|nr:hypothetical protein [Cryobacterium zhongshanensis]MCI4659611.1 hypothetical protein [Cryobacterium zhongshanensis]